MEQLEVIKQIHEPTKWCPPLVVMPKADREGFGYVLTLQGLTKHSVEKSINIPTVEETLGSLTEGSVYSKLDVNSGFHQKVLNPESAKLITTFMTPFRGHMLNRLPFGISSAPEYFRRE